MNNSSQNSYQNKTENPFLINTLVSTIGGIVMNKFLKVFLCLTLALVLSLPSLARDWYVHRDLGADSPARDGTDNSSQWLQTINYAISRASSHDVIYVYGWTSNNYNERVVIPTSKNNLTIRAKTPTQKPVIDGLGLSSANQSFGIYVKSDNCKLINLKIQNFKAATNAGDFTSNNEGGVGIYADPGLSGTYIEGVEIYACNWGIYLPENSRTTIVKSVIGASGTNAITSLASNGGVGIALWSNGTTIEKNLIGKLSDNTSGNQISYCDADGIRVGYSTSSGGSADQTEIAYNTITNCGTVLNGFGINIQRVTRTVNVKYNTIQNCVNGLDIDGPCLDLSVSENLFIDVGLTTDVLVRTSSNYDGIMLFDIWKRNKNQFLQGTNLVNNSAASVEKTQNSVMTSQSFGSYRFIRNTIQSVWNNDVTTGHRLGVKGYNPAYPTVGSPTSFVYYENLNFSGTDDVEIYGESDANPQYTQIITSDQDVCAGTGDPYGIELRANDLELHGFKITGPTPANNTYSVNILVDGTNINIHHNIIEVQSQQTTNTPLCLSYGIANEIYTAIGDAIVDGLQIHNNTFTHNHSAGNWGYAGILINHADNGEITSANNIRIEKNMFEGNLQYGVIAQQSGVTINENTFITNLTKSGDGNWDNGEGYMAIRIHDPSSSNLEQNNINITCNIITGSATGKGFLIGMYLGEPTDAQLLTANVSSNVIENVYLGVYVGSAEDVINSGTNGVTIQNNDFGYDYDVPSPTGISNGALDNVSSYTINATDNWWGTPNGPRHISNTYNIPLQGEKVFGNVTFVPWWGAAPTGTCPLISTSTSVGPVTLRTNATETLVSYHTSIQSAINAATALNGIIWATAGTYTENLNFNNSNVVALKGKKLDGLTNAFTAGTAGADPSERAILESDDETQPMVTIATDGITIQGFEFSGNMTSPEDPTYVIWIDAAPITNLTLQYNTILMGNEDYGVVATDGNGLSNAVITYNKFIGESTNANSDWFSIGDRSGSNLGGYTNNLQLTYNDINYASAKFRLSERGNISNITIENNTFNNVNGAIKVGRDENDPPSSFSLYNFNILSNVFNNTSFPNEFAFMLVNEQQISDNFRAFAIADLGGSNLSEFTINYNQILYESTGLYSAVGIAGNDNDYGISGFPTFTASGQINARSNWWGSQYGPKVAPYTATLNQANFANWWDNAGNGTILWPIQRSSWNQHLQGATCGNLFIDFHPWWQTATGPDINGPIQVKNDNNTITTYPSFFDAIFDNAACDDDGQWDIVSATSGTYTEDFGIWKNFVELRGVSDANPNAVVIKSTRSASTYPSDYFDAIGLYLQKDNAPVNNVRIRGITFEGPTPNAGEYSVLVFVNGTNIRIHNCEFRVPVSNNPSYISSAIRTHNELLDFSPDNSINGLYIHDNTFTHFGTLPSSLGYNGIILNYELGLGANSIRVFDNTFTGNLYTGILVSAPGVTVRGNNLTSDVQAFYGIAVIDNYTSGPNVLNNITISCNNITNTHATATYSYGIWFPNTDLSDPDFAAPINVINNTINKCGVGVRVDENADQITVNFNNFNGTYTSFAVQNTHTTPLDATQNYWGSVNGPSHISNAYGSPQGGAISNNVNYLPFWTNWINQCPGNAIGSPLYPVIVYDNLSHTTQIGVYASINAAINDPSTLATHVIYAANGTFYENVTTKNQANYLESAGTTTINGNFTLLHQADITIVSPYKVTGNLNFAGVGNQSSIILQNADFEVIGNLNGASSPTSPPFNNYIATTGTGSFIKGGINSLDNNILPLHAGLGNYFFPLQLKVNQTGISNAKFKARVNGQNPASFFGKGEVDNPVDNVWFMELFDATWNPITNSNSDVYFYFPETGSWPLGFATTTGTEVDGCWSTSAVLGSVFGARWDGSAWESRKGNSDAPGTAVCRVQQVNTFSPWGVFWGYSNAALEEPPTHANNLQFIGVSTNSLTIRVNRGSGERFMVIVKPGNQAPDCWTCYPGQPGEYPSDGEEYASAPYNVSTDPNNADWNTGYPLGSNPNPALRPRIVYVSPMNSVDLGREVTITNLDHGTKYYVQVIELNGSGLSYPNYNVRGWCNLDLSTVPNYNGRWRMTIPIIDLKFKVPPQNGPYAHHACNTWQDYFHITGSGEPPWTVKYSDGVTTWALSSPVQSFNPYFQAVVPTTESRTYSLVLVKDASERLCETTGYPELYIHTPTTFTSGNEVTVNPNPACNGTSTVTFTPNVTGTDASFIRWEVNEGSGYYALNNSGGTLGTGTAYSINTSTGVLTLTTPTTADNGFSFVVYYTGSATCGQPSEIASPAQVLTVNAGPNPGTLSSVQTMPICPNNAVTLNLTGVSADNWTWQRSTDGGSTFNDITGYVNVTTTTYIIPAADVTEANSGNYVYRIIAYRAGCSPETTPVTGYWTLQVIQSPANWSSNNANISLVSTATNTMTITWDAASGASYYRVNVWRVSTSSYFYTNLYASSNTLTIGPPSNPLPDCEDFGFEITAYNTCNNPNTTSNMQTFSSYCPSITLTPQNTCPTAYNFGSVFVGATSTSTFSYALTGTSLSTNVSVTLPSSDFEIRASSDGGSTWTPDWTTSALSLNYVHLNNGGTWSIQVRFRPQAANTYSCATITHSSSPAASKIQYVSGVGVDNSPTVQASNICFSNIDDQNDQNITITWTRGNGAGIIVVVSSDQTWEPLGTATYTAGNFIGSSNDYVAYVGTGTSVNVNLSSAGISAGQNFYVRAYEYNTSSGLNFYSVATNATNPNMPKFLVFTTQPSTGQNINSGANFTVVVQSQYRDGTLYIPSVNENVTISIYSGTGTLTTSPATPQISNSTGNTGNVTVTWTYGDGVLDAQLQASASCSWVTGLSNKFNIIPSTPTTQTRTMIVTGFANCGGGNVDVNLRWTNGNGLHRILVVRQGQGPAVPSDGDFYYDANGNWSDASKESIGGDNSSWVVDRIDVNNPGGTYTTTVYNLPGNTTFYFRVFDYNGNATGITRYNTNSASFNPIQRTTPACKAGAADFYVDADDFKAQSYSRKVYLSWNTYIEQGILGYELYRADANASDNYTLVGSYLSDKELQAGINSYSTRSYSFVDNDAMLVVGNEYHYRLMAVAIDGSKFDVAEQLVTINITEDPNSRFVVNNINPNPATDEIRFELEMNAENAITVEVMDVSGRVVTSPINAKIYNPGKHFVTVPLGDIASGTYLLMISSGSDVVMHTFVVKK